MRTGTKTNEQYPLLITEEYWANSPLSVVRYTGEIRFSGHEYIIVNKDGKDIYQCSMEAHKAGRAKAIEPGEPCDLVLKSLVRVYKKLGRDVLIEKIKSGMSEKELLALVKKQKRNEERNVQRPLQPDLFGTDRQQDDEACGSSPAHQGV